MSTIATRDFVWRTAPTSDAAEGTSEVYVDSMMGNDDYTDSSDGTTPSLRAGSRQHPFKTLGKAWGLTTKPSVIVCRGVFSEDVIRVYSDVNALLCGDFWGAAYFEGNGEYMLSGFRMKNFIVRDLPVNAEKGIGCIVQDGKCTLSCENVVLDNSPLLYGSLISNTASIGIGNLKERKHLVISSPKYSDSHKIFMCGDTIGGEVPMKNCTLYNIPKAAVNISNTTSNNTVQINATLFAKVAISCNRGYNAILTFNNCCFAADCEFYVGTSSPTKITLNAPTSAERQAQLEEAISNQNISFNNCLFSSQTSDKIFNNPDNGDFTLKLDSDAAQVFGEFKYCGALPPALNIPIMSDKSENDPPVYNEEGGRGSEKYPQTWDEKSAVGCISVVDDMICVDSDPEKEKGAIYSKIIKINPVTTQLNAIFAIFHNQWDKNHAYANRFDIFRDYSNAQSGSITEAGSTPESYASGDTILSSGKYLSTADAEYMGSPVGAGGIVAVDITQTGGDSFTSSVQKAAFIKIVEPNILDCIYVRCRTTIYKYVKAAGTDAADPETLTGINVLEGLSNELVPGGIYLNPVRGNNIDKNIIYRDRVIVPGESFIATDSEPFFTCPDNGDYTIAIMFDDPRVPSASEWVPAQTFGEYFVAKEAGAIKKDTHKVPMGSGNYSSYQAMSLYKSIIDRVYVQFAIFVNKYAYLAD